MPLFVPLLESGRSALRLRGLPVVLLAIFGNMTAILGPIIVAILSIVMLAWFVLAELAGKRDEKDQRDSSAEYTVQLLHEMLRREKPVDEKNRLIVDTTTLADGLSLLLVRGERQTHQRLREELGEPPYGDGMQDIIKAENERIVESFNREYLHELRSIVERANPYEDVSFDPVAIQISQSGAKTSVDIHAAYAALDDLSRQLIYIAQA